MVENYLISERFDFRIRFFLRFNLFVRALINYLVKKESVILNHFAASILIFQYKSKIINIANRFGG